MSLGFSIADKSHRRNVYILVCWCIQMTYPQFIDGYGCYCPSVLSRHLQVSVHLPTLMPMGIVVISCIRPFVRPSMGLSLSIAEFLHICLFTTLILLTDPDDGYSLPTMSPWLYTAKPTKFQNKVISTNFSNMEMRSAGLIVSNPTLQIAQPGKPGGNIFVRWLGLIMRPWNSRYHT